MPNTNGTDAKAKAEQIRSALVAEVIAAIAADPLHWSKSWTASGSLPYNGSTGARYRGGNVLWLWSEALDRGYATNAWATYKQWAGVGAQVRKNETATQCLFWKVWSKEGVDGKTKSIPMLRTFSVFNLAQVDIVDEARFTKASRVVPPPTTVTEWPGQTLLAAVPAVIVDGEPSYSRFADVVAMPEPGSFVDGEHYAVTLAHELGHWTGHPERLDRPVHARWGDDAYAFEELVAELTAVFFAAHVGIEHHTRPDHVGYLAHWVRRFADDPQALWTAATKASAAFEALAAYSEALVPA